MYSPEQLQHAVEAIHYLAPCVQFVYFYLAIAVSLSAIPKVEVKQRKVAPRNALLLTTALVILTYVSSFKHSSLWSAANVHQVGEAVLVIAQIFTGDGPMATKDHNIYALSSIIVWFAVLAVLLSSEHPKWWPFCGFWFFALATDLILLGLSMCNFWPSNQLEYAQIGFQILRLCLLFAHFILYIAVGRNESRSSREDEEAAPLLGHAQENSGDTQKSGSSSGYGSASADNASKSVSGTIRDDDDDDDDETKETKKEREKIRRMHDRMREKGNWLTYAREFLIFVPYIWPSKRWDLHLNMVGIGFCLLCVRALNVLVPRQLGIVINSLGHDNGNSAFLQLCFYIGLYWASSGAGIMALKNWLYIPIELNAVKSIKMASYNHIMGLSCDFHDSKQSGELYTAMHQGSSVVDLLEMLLFNLVPMMVDLLVACAFLYSIFDAYMFLIVVATMIAYLWTSTYFTTKQASVRRQNTALARAEYQTLYDTMGGWKTVSYFNRRKHASTRYGTAVTKYTESRKTVWLLYYFSASIQGLVLDIGLFGACFYAVYQMLYGGQTVGNFVTLLTYWSGLAGPLDFLSTAHREMLSNLIDAEQLLVLFQTKSSIKDGPKTLQLSHGGQVDFEHVKFGYDGKKQTINDLGFHVAPGQTIALIGETGGGKSTILKLVFRFYDVTGGSIRIDGQDIRDVTVESLRELIGVVPQDPSLFNETIMENVRYAKLDASDEEVTDACKAAAVHDKILTFTDGYHSKVGEHGVKLSGGELQRIAIARAILKDPKIILLDEATSAVDSETEGKIQEALKKLANGRTTFVVAHRLSTIMDADLILVIKDGTIIEKGPPAELLKAKGKYYDLWSTQMGISNRVSIEEEVETPNKSDKDDDQQSDPEIGDETRSGREGQPDESKKNNSDKIRPSLPSKGSKKSSSLVGSVGTKIFRPDAPEFVPNYQSGTAAKGCHTGKQQDHSTHRHEYSNITSKGPEKENKFGSRKRKSKQDTLRTGSSEQDGGNADPRNLQQVPDTAQSLDATTGKESEPKVKKTRFNWRNQSKSEPFSQPLVLSQGDGTSEFDASPVESGKGKPMAFVSRRVFAPSDPPLGPTTARLMNHSQRRRRSRHWKQKNRDASSGSGNPSRATSTDWSTDSHNATYATGPFTSPVTEMTSSNEMAGSVSTRGVRFAPES
ncbi:MAG: hypothetical protein Q9187_005037 [Circinaria calcarea]